MTANSLYPAFVEINYASAYGVHKMRLPTVPIVLNGVHQFTLRGLALPVGVHTAVNEFVDKIVPMFPATTTFVDYTAYTMDSPTAVATPVKSGAIGKVGTTGTTGADYKATQWTWTFRTDAFGIFKIVMLDCLVSTWELQKSLAGWAAGQALVDYVVSENTFIAGRDGGRPITFLQLSATLNERLRKAYRMN